METNVPDQETPADADDSAGFAAVAPIAIFSLLSFLLLVLQKNCFAFAFTEKISFALGIIVGLVYLGYWLPRSKKLGLRFKGMDRRKPPAPGEEVLGVLLLGLLSAFFCWVCCLGVMGALVRFTSHVAHDYDATVTKVMQSKQECKFKVEFVDEVLQEPVTQCTQKFDEAQTGMQVRVQSLTGPIGVRFLSVKRADPQVNNVREGSG